MRGRGQSLRFFAVIIGSSSVAIPRDVCRRVAAPPCPLRQLQRRRTGEFVLSEGVQSPLASPFPYLLYRQQGGRIFCELPQRTPAHAGYRPGVRRGASEGGFGRIWERLLLTRRWRPGAGTRWSDLNAHLIGKDGFLKGNGSGFRIEPAELVATRFSTLGNAS